MSRTSRGVTDSPLTDTRPGAPIEATRVTDMGALLAGQAREITPSAVIADRYRIEGLLGNGGMADVVLATDLVLDRQVAVKLLREATDSEGDLSRFLAETHTLARLSHPGLVTVLDGGTMPGGHPYLVMELVDGPSLSASLDSPMDPVRVAEVGAQVAAALAYAHTQGVVHRDVKPGNVLLRGDGRVKLADFGIAKLVGDRSRHTRTGTVLGSVHYLAPEQVAFEEITPAVDVYGLGLLLLRCLTGRHAFEGPTIESALARLSADPEVPADLPSGWRELLTSMTARAPQERPTAAEVAGRLAWLSGARTTTRVVPPLPVGHRATPRTRDPGLAVAGWLSAARSRVSPLAVGAVLLAVLLFAAAAMAGQDPGADGPATKPPSSQSDPGPQTEPGTDQPLARVQPVAQAVVPAAEVPAAAGQHQPKAKHPKSKKDKSKHKPGKGKPRPGKGKPGKAE